MRRAIVVAAVQLLFAGSACAASFDYHAAARAVVTVFCPESKGFGGGVVLSRLSVVSMGHVVNPCKQVLVGYRDGSFSLGSVTKADPGRDLVLIHPERMPEIQPFATLDPALPAVGDRLFVVSHPDGHEWSYSEGYMAYPDERNVTAGSSGRRVTVIQVNVPIARGSSGGALFNGDGEVVGFAEGALVTNATIAYFVPAAAVCKQLMKCKVG